MSDEKTVKRTERGWAGHFICSARCQFRRNTLLECDGIQIVVSTVGLLRDKRKIEPIGCNRYFETMAFLADPTDTRYHDASVRQPVSFRSNWSIDEPDADDLANDMHETVVDEFVERLENGEQITSDRKDEDDG